MRTIAAAICVFLVSGAVWALPARAETTEPEAAPAAAEAADTAEVPGFGGPSSVTGTLTKDAKDKEIPATQEDWFQLRFDYNALLLSASESPGEDTAASGVLRAYGQWILAGRETDDQGLLIYKVENRHRLGTDIAPKDLGFEVGYAGLPAVTFSDAGWVLTNLYWSQHFNNNRLAFVAGVVDITDYTDVYGLVNIWTDFNNYAFATSPTIPAPDQGLGAAVRYMFTDNYYVIGGLADANGHPTAPGKMFSSFFSDAEFFTHLEAGWISSWEKRYNDNIHVVYWHADEREEAGVSDGSGLTFSFSRLYDNTWEPFLRVGTADDGGALWERTVSTGCAWHRPRGDALGVGLNWSRPNEDTLGADLDDQFTSEVYYRWQATKDVAITPSIQWLRDPALNPDEDSIFILGLRARANL